MRLDKYTTARRTKDRSLPQDLPLRVLADQWLVRHHTEDLHILDVCCGRGALLSQMPNLLGPNIERIFYHGFDIHIDFVKETQEVGKRVHIRTEARVGELEALRPLFGDTRYTVIALVNVLHELPLAIVPDLFLDLLEMCADDGCIYVFDIATLPYSEPEPGALPWRVKDVNCILQALSSALGMGPTGLYASTYRSNQGGWYFTLYKAAVPHSADVIAHHRPGIKRQILEEIMRTFTRRRDDIDDEIHNYAYELYQRTSDCDLEDEPGAVTRLRQQIDMEVRDFWSCVSELKSLERGGR